MWVLFTAILLASLLGSTHCVGMCGPLALWASGTLERNRRGRLFLNTTLYHTGRLIAYTLVGIAAGVIGRLVNLGGESVGLQMLAARVVGGLMIGMGLYRLASLLPQRSTTDALTKRPKPSWITKTLVALRPAIFALPVSLRAFSAGGLTAFLPCWLAVRLCLRCGRNGQSLRWGGGDGRVLDGDRAVTNGTCFECKPVESAISNRCSSCRRSDACCDRRLHRKR